MISSSGSAREASDASCDGPPVLLDAHCHLGAYLDREAVLSRAAAVGVHVVCATARPSEYRDLVARFAGDDALDVGLGFHPEYAGSIYVPYEWEIFERHLDDATWISEVGLDGVIAAGTSPHFGAVPTMEAQLELFVRVLEHTSAARPLSVHSRGAESEVLALLGEYRRERVVLHSFAGTADQVDDAVGRGWLVSVHPSMVDADPGRRVLAALPLEHLLVETDGPYFDFEGRQIEPGDCAGFVAQLAALRGIEPLDLREQIAANGRAFVDA